MKKMLNPFQKRKLRVGKTLHFQGRSYYDEDPAAKAKPDILETFKICTDYGYHSFKQSGKTISALCPFHEEKTASFVMYPETHSYHCFGCNESGDSYTLVMKTQNMTFLQAKEFCQSNNL